MVKAPRSIGLTSAGSKNQEICTPPASGGFVQQALRIMGTDGALETVEQQHPGLTVLGRQAVNLEEISVGSVPTLECGLSRSLAPEQFSPQRLQMSTGNPP